MQERALPKAPWKWTDDTAMALSVFDVLEQHGQIVGDALAARFAMRYAMEPMRGYGGGAHQVLSAIAAGDPWQNASAALFDGSGSYGNGGAMRVASVGGYFADDFKTVAAQGVALVLFIYSYFEGQAGAAAIAVATAFAAASRGTNFDRDTFFEAVLQHTSPGDVWNNVAAVRDTPQKPRLSRPCNA